MIKKTMGNQVLDDRRSPFMVFIRKNTKNEPEKHRVIDPKHNPSHHCNFRPRNVSLRSHLI